MVKALNDAIEAALDEGQQEIAAELLSILNELDRKGHE
jgi:hypothetical protein